MPSDKLVNTLLDDLLDPDGRGLDPRILAGATRDMQGRTRIMPRYLGTGIRALTLVFGAGYVRLPKQRRVARIERWRTSPLSPMRDWVDFFEKMGTFAYYTNVEHAQ